MRAIWLFNRNRISFWRSWWWRPHLSRQNLATGSYEGWHLTWGPLHVWNTMDHNKKRSKGWGWR